MSPSPSPQSHDRFALVVDDDPAHRFLNVRLVKAAAPHLTIIEATHPAEGIQCVEKLRHAIEVLLSDWSMPHLTGQQPWDGHKQGVKGGAAVLRAARENAISRRILVTSSLRPNLEGKMDGHHEDVRAILAVQPHAILPKHFDLHQSLVALQAAIADDNFQCPVLAQIREQIAAA